MSTSDVSAIRRSAVRWWLDWCREVASALAVAQQEDPLGIVKGDDTCGFPQG